MAQMIEVRLPDFGDGDDASVGAVVSCWLATVGSDLEIGDDFLEIVTDKASFVVPCPCKGILREQRVQEEDAVKSGDIIAIIESL
ncbi:MAG: lipoyl domain-containing protein [Candidatus Hydrogenedentales bacterium]|jgi:pyruvate/2-oxoglutarate dehydrogenase complex dihydrolipoamide acyltransferase (E2) component